VSAPLHEAVAEFVGKLRDLSERSVIEGDALAVDVEVAVEKLAEGIVAEAVRSTRGHFGQTQVDRAARSKP
jgi:hypothetical protein